MSITTIAEASQALRDAEAERRARARLTAEWPGLDLDTAYQVQQETIRRGVDAGAHVIGIKLGLTSRAKQERMGISSPLTGVLLDAYSLPAGSPVPLDRLIHPRVEPEIVFLLGRELHGPGLTAATAFAAVERVYGGVEIIDSRFVDYDFALPDVIADNASSAYFCLGGHGVAPDRIDLLHEATVLGRNGAVVDTATGAAVQGHPAEALALAANELGRRGIAIPAGSLVLTGGMTDAIPLSTGDHVSAEFTTLGTVTLTT